VREPMSPVRRVHVIVTGRVQGVWYRGAMQHEAERLGVAGWVRNVADGNVEAAIEGPAQAVDELVAWCRVGPPGARVQNVRCAEEPPQGIQGFRIAR